MADGATVELIEAPFDLGAIGVAWGTIASAGLAWHLQRLPHDPACLGANAAAMAANGARCATSEYLDALATTANSRVKAAALFERFDMLLCPPPPRSPGRRTKRFRRRSAASRQGRGATLFLPPG